jgi:2-keto-3-deoxy-L-rhamnonate aldolase RhmA
MKTLTGTFLSLGSAAVAELAVECGLDWALLDLEHGCGTETDLLHQLRCFRGGKTRSIVRVGALHSDLIARTLDWGADGIMLPHVDAVEKAEQLVKAAYYPPRGSRGYSRTVRAHRFGMQEPSAGTKPVLMAQIETLAGVEKAGEIAAVDGVDVLFVGPADLRFDLTNRGMESRFDQCLEATVMAAKAAGKQAGILVRDPAEKSRFENLGFTWLAMESDISLLRKAWQGLK